MRTEKHQLTAKQLKFKEILGQDFIELEVEAISDADPNRNGSHFTIESLNKLIERKGVTNKPIVGFFEKGDFTTHEGVADYDSELDQEYWNTARGERILGWVRESDPVELIEKDGLTWLKFRCILCISYCYQQVKRLLKDRHKKVSVEITVNEYEKRDDGIYDITDFTLNGVTILGSKNGKQVMEGIEGAHATVLDHLDEECLNEQRKVLSFAYEKIDSEANEDKTGNGDPDPILNETGKEEVMENKNFEAEQMAQEEVEATESAECTTCECEQCAAATEPEEAEAEVTCAAEEEPKAEEGESEEEYAEEKPEVNEPAEELEMAEEKAEEPVEETCAAAEEAPHGEDCDCEDCRKAAEQAAYEAEKATMSARIAELEAKCEEYCATIARMENEACENQAKYEEDMQKFANYEEIVTRMEKAELEVHNYFCAELKRSAIEMMSEERINRADYEAIIAKCEKGEYSCDEDIKRDVAYAAYNARPATEKRFSVSIDVPSHEATGTKPLTREQRLASMRSGK